MYEINNRIRLICNLTVNGGDVAINIGWIFELHLPCELQMNSFICFLKHDETFTSSEFVMNFYAQYCKLPISGYILLALYNTYQVFNR